jgi:hypothetical protein
MFANQYEEHLAHSAPCSSQWDGFDRGDSGRDVDCVEIIVTIIGRMTNGAGQRVVIEEIRVEGDVYHCVLVDGDKVFWEDNNRPRAITVARWWMAGCPA